MNKESVIQFQKLFTGLQRGYGILRRVVPYLEEFGTLWRTRGTTVHPTTLKGAGENFLNKKDQSIRLVF